MEYQVLARKWRPQGFTDLIGQEQVARTLQNAITMERVAHAYLFTGVRGVGKTSSARILAKALNCEQGPTPNPCNQCQRCKQISAGSYLDVLEIDGASNTGVDDVRDLKENIQYLPTQGRFKIYIIDEVHMLSKAAFNALLKTLEEPPKGVVFILATTEVHKLPETILSRCQRFDFKRVSAEVIAQRLRQICADEGVKVSDALLQAVARESQGSVRDALTLADRLISYCGKQVDETQGRADLLGLVDRQALSRLLTAIVAANPAVAVAEFHKIYFAGFDIKRLLESLLQEFRNALMIKIGLKSDQLGLSVDEESQNRAIFKELSEIEIERLLDLAKFACQEVGRSDQELFVGESALIKMAHVRGDFTAVQEALNLLRGQPAAAREAAGKPLGQPQASSSAATSPAVATTAKPAVSAAPVAKDHPLFAGNAPRPAAPATAPQHETIEDPYVKETVGLFGAKVEKIQIRED